jgi:hypothetical protein
MLWTLFRRRLFPVSTRTSAILNDGSRCYPQFLQANAKIPPRLGYCRFLPNPFQFIITPSCHLTRRKVCKSISIRRCLVSVLKTSLNNLRGKQCLIFSRGIITKISLNVTHSCKNMQISFIILKSCGLCQTFTKSWLPSKMAD